MTNTAGVKSRKIASSYSNIACGYIENCEYEHAIEMCEKAISINETILGTEHPSTATSYHNMGSILYAQGNSTDAVKWFQKALIGRSSNPISAATTYNGLGAAFSRCGDNEKALDLYQKAWSLNMETLGSEHPNVALNLHNIAIIHDLMNNFELAMEHYNRASSIYEKMLGGHHPDTGRNYEMIGFCYAGQSQYDEAVIWFEKAMIIYSTAFGPKNPRVINIQKAIEITRARAMEAVTDHI